MMRMMLLLSRPTASPPRKLKLLSQSLIPPGCLVQRPLTLKYRPRGVGHYCHLNRFYSHDAALAASEGAQAVDRHDLHGAVPRGLHARMARAREAEKLRLARQKSAEALSILKKGLAARLKRTEAKKQKPDLDWLVVVRQAAKARRARFELLGDEDSLDWEDVFDANLEQLTALLAAQRAATDAEEAMNRADPAAPASMDEARRLKDNATRLAELEAQQAEIYNEIRGRVRAKREARPASYLQDPDHNIATAHIFLRCPICFMPHSPSSCPYLFENPKDWVVKVSPNLVDKASLLFQKRWEADAKFREALLYLRSKFTRAPGSFQALPLPLRHTIDAPPSAIPYLQQFERQFWFKDLNYQPPKTSLVGDKLSLLQGFYRTTDDDGFPLMILFPVAAPSDISSDPRFEHEVRLMRSFAACWRKGQMSKYGLKPFADAQQISIIICEGRWHMSRNMWAGQQVLSVSIASEETWKKGEFYRSLHIGSRNNEVTGDYGWWSCGQILQQKWVHHKGWTTRSLLTSHTTYKRNMVYATLRDVHEPARPVLYQDVRERKPQALRELIPWRREMERRAIEKYGAGSEQAILCSKRRELEDLGLPVEGGLEQEVGQDKDNLGWVPSWETIMDLGQRRS